MDSNDELTTFKNMLCFLCLDTYEGALAEHHPTINEDEGRDAKDVYQLEREAQEMEIKIVKSLSVERRDECWLLVASVQDLANSKARYFESNCAEQELLYNILISKAWKAAASFIPGMSKFSTWVYKPWCYAIREFWRVKRLRTKTLTDYAVDATQYEKLSKSDGSRLPSEHLEAMELTEWAEHFSRISPLLKLMLYDSCQQYEWLCPLCRRKMRVHFSQQSLVGLKCTDLPKRSFQSAYARRAFWQLFE